MFAAALLLLSLPVHIATVPDETCTADQCFDEGALLQKRPMRHISVDEAAQERGGSAEKDEEDYEDEDGPKSAWPTGGNYNEKLARVFAEITQASYCGPKSNLTGWECESCKKVYPSFKVVPDTMTFVSVGDVLSSDAIFAFVARLELKKQSPKERDCVLSIRGTNNKANQWRDLANAKSDFFNDETKVCDGCKVQYGFNKVWQKMRTTVIDTLTQVGCDPALSPSPNVFVTGHSLGAAVSYLAMYDLKQQGFKVRQSYVFEPPMPGNSKFRDGFNKEFAGADRAFTITYSDDPVPHYPFLWLGFRPVGQEVYYAEDGSYQICPMGDYQKCSLQSNVCLYPKCVDHHCNNFPLVESKNICNPSNDICNKVKLGATQPHHVHIQ